MTKKAKKTKKNPNPEMLPMVSQYGCASYVMITSRYAAVKKILNFVRSKGYNEAGCSLIEENLATEFSSIQRELAVLANTAISPQQALAWELDELGLLQAEEMNKAFIEFERGKHHTEIKSLLPDGTLKFVYGLYTMRKARGEVDGLPVTYYLPSYYNMAVSAKGYGNITIQHLVSSLYGDTLRRYERSIDTSELLEKLLHVGISIHVLFTEEASAYPAVDSFNIDDMFAANSIDVIPFAVTALVDLIDGHRVVRKTNFTQEDVEQLSSGLELLFIAHYGAQKDLTLEQAAEELEEDRKLVVEPTQAEELI